MPTVSVHFRFLHCMSSFYLRGRLGVILDLLYNVLNNIFFHADRISVVCEILPFHRKVMCRSEKEGKRISGILEPCTSTAINNRELVVCACHGVA